MTHFEAAGDSGGPREFRGGHKRLWGATGRLRGLWGVKEGNGGPQMIVQGREAREVRRARKGAAGGHEGPRETARGHEGLRGSVRIHGEARGPGGRWGPRGASRGHEGCEGT
jgi:hypothetical protein